jgi:hypothetical protein
MTRPNEETGGGGGGGGGFNLPGFLLGGVGSIFQGLSTEGQTLAANIMNYQNRQVAQGHLNDIRLTEPQRGAAVNQALDASQDWIRRLEQNYATEIPRLQGMVDQMGQQQTRDINQAFGNQQSQAAADLSSRGFSGSSIGPTVSAGIERQHMDALGQLKEQLLGQNMNVWNAKQQMFGNNANAIFGLQQYPLGLATADVGRYLQLLSGFNNVPPDQGLSAGVSQQLGPLAINPPRATSSDQIGPALFGGAAGLTGTYATTKFFGNPACIDADSLITMASGLPKPLREIRKGDLVLGTSGKRRWVQGIDLGKQTARDLHLRMTFGKYCLVISKDHIIGGKPAGDWHVGQSHCGVPLTMIEAVQPLETGDLLLEAGDGYYANGLPIASMLALANVSEAELDDFHHIMKV